MSSPHGSAKPGTQTQNCECGELISGGGMGGCSGHAPPSPVPALLSAVRDLWSTPTGRWLNECQLFLIIFPLPLSSTCHPHYFSTFPLVHEDG